MLDEGSEDIWFCSQSGYLKSKTILGKTAHHLLPMFLPASSTEGKSYFRMKPLSKPTTQTSHPQSAYEIWKENRCNLYDGFHCGESGSDWLTDDRWCFSKVSIGRDRNHTTFTISDYWSLWSLSAIPSFTDYLIKHCQIRQFYVEEGYAVA